MKYVKIIDDRPFFLQRLVYVDNVLQETTESLANSLGYKPLIEEPPATENYQVARIAGYHVDGDSIVADYEVIAIEEATRDELREKIGTIDTSDMDNYTKTGLLQIIALLLRA